MIGALLIASACGSQTSTEAESPALEAALTRPATLAASCSGCHGQTSGAIISLDTLSEPELLERLRTYADDAGGTTVMHRLARGYSEDEMTAIANFLTNHNEGPSK